MAPIEAIPTTQKAWFQTARGKPADVLQLKEGVPVPKPANGEVLVRVHSVALNPVGYKLMQTLPSLVAKLPANPESDLSGWVVDANGSQFVVGDEVLGMIETNARIKTGHGAMAQYVAVKADHLVKKPNNLPFDQAAGLPVVGLTAYQGLIGYDIVKPGDRIFINGGSSSVGSVAVQIAKKVAGAVVGTSCSAANEEMVRKLGADEVFDYKASPLPDQLAAKPPYSSVFDCIGTQSLYTSSPRFLSPNGKYITTSADMHGQSTLQAAKTTLEVAANMFRPKWAGGTPREFKIFMMVYKRNELEDLVRWCAEGKLTVPIDSVHKADQAGVLTAYERIMSNRAKGKVVVTMHDL